MMPGGYESYKRMRTRIEEAQILNAEKIPICENCGVRCSVCRSLKMGTGKGCCLGVE